MKMKKIAVALLCALLLSLALVALSANVFAADTLEYALKIKFDSTECSVSYSVDGASPVNMTSETPYMIPRGSNVLIKVTPKSGYKLDSFINDASGLDDRLNFEQPELNVAPFNADASYTVSCAVRTFNVLFLPVEGMTGTPDYAYPGQKPVTYTFKGQTELVAATKPGYDFVAWEVLDADGTVISTVNEDADGKYILNLGAAIPKGSDETGTISIRAKFKAKQYDVYRYDRVYDVNSPTGGDPLGRVDFLADMNFEVFGYMGPDTVYPGYYFISTDPKYYTSKKVNIFDPETDGIEKGNNIYRFYLPIEYALAINLDGGALLEGEVLPTTHVFNADTRIPTPTRRGYTFAGWRITITKGGETVSLNPWEYDSEDRKDMLLTAKNAELAGDKDTEIVLDAIWVVNQYPIIYVLNGGQSAENQPNLYSFDRDLLIPDPTRRGYTFVGWILKLGDAQTGVEVGKGLTLQKEQYESALTLEAVWKANTYTVIFDGMGASNSFTTEILATFDKCPVVAMDLPIRPQYRFLGYFTDAQGGNQYVDANGEFVKNWDLTENTILYARWELLPVLNINDAYLKIDYENERFDFPDGVYTVRLGGEDLTFSLEDGVGANRILDHFFGKELTVIVHADGVEYSDYTTVIRLAARPAEPTANQYTIVDNGEGKLNIQLTGSAIYEFALALSDSPDQFLFPWQDSPVFEGLQEGENYYLFIRVKASEHAPKSTTVMLDLITATQVDLTVLIISLAVVALCQFIAIVLILGARVKRKRETRLSASFAPMLLTTLYFLPKNGDLVALILGGVVILFQIILTYLILSSDLVRRDNNGEEEDSEEVFLELDESEYPADGETDAAEVVYDTDEMNELASETVVLMNTVEEGDEETPAAEADGEEPIAFEPIYTEDAEPASAPVEEEAEEPYLFSIPTSEETLDASEEAANSNEPRW